MAEALAARYDVTYVDERSAAGPARVERRQVADGLEVLTLPRLPSRPERLRELTDAWQAALVARRLPGPWAVWCYGVRGLPAVRRLGAATTAWWTGDEVVERRAPELSAAVGHVLKVTTEVSEEDRRRHGAKAVPMGMAVDPAPYAAAATRAAPPEDLRALPRPWVGYGGLLNARIDWPLVGRLATEHPRASFVFVGPEMDGDGVAARAAVTARHPNVHLLGHRDEPASFDYLAAFDVGLVPYAPTAFNLGSNPTKFYEYLAAGTPVVSLAIPSLPAVPGTAWLAADGDAFAAALAEALAAPPAPDRARAVAAEHSYAALVGRVARVLEGAA
jgi:hypothetical protein